MLTFVIQIFINLPLIVTSLSWSNCKSDEPILTFNSFNLEGNPIVIGDSANPLRFTLVANLTEPLDDQIIAKIGISKAITVFGKRVVLPDFPCIRGFGSCDINLCDYLTSRENLLCSLLNFIDRPCSCPIEPGLITINNLNYHMDLSNIPKMLLWLSSGDYNIHIVLVKDDQSLGCFHFDMDLEMTNVSHENDQSKK